MSTVLPMTFTSQTGSQFPKSGLSFSLPPSTQPFTATGHVNRMQDAMQDVEEADGVYLTSGSDNLYRSYAEVSGTFDFFPAWLRTNSNRNYYSGVTDDRAACLNAVLDFMLYVVSGGLGTLVLTNPTGATYASYTASALINGDYTVQYVNGAARAQIQCAFMIPSAMWTAPGGVLVPVH